MKIILFCLLFFNCLSFAQQPKVVKTTKKVAPKFSRPYGMAGCGLGSVVMGKEGSQVFAATTNGSSWNQTFGISAGSLNCVDSPSTEVASRLDQFILVNRSQVQGDIARGSGETIAALSQYMGCGVKSEQLGAELKANYGTIFSSGFKTNEITDSIISVILHSPELSENCQHLG